MLNIDKNLFSLNLSITQEYCRLQIDKNENDNAKVFRSYNPLIKDKPLFSFKVQLFNSDIEPDLNYCTLTEWIVDPTERENENLVDKLYEQQINFKKKNVALNDKQIHHGDILVSQIDCTVIDGASEVQSLGLIDIYDMPPIDTWFYLTRSKESRLLFAWIPADFKHYANEAVLVNCVNCINWFEKWYPKDFDNITTK